MSKEVFLVFQDCPYCAPREKWGEEQKRVAAENSIHVVPTHFNTPGVDGLITKAMSRGINSLPFFTDGERFSYNLIDFTNRKPKAAKQEDAPAEAPQETKTEVATSKKTRRKVEIEDTDGDNQTS